MSQDFLSMTAAWSGQAVVVHHDEPTGTWVFIALHDSTLGPPTGGTRMKVYPSPLDGLEDVQRLAEGMTHKWAGLGMNQGGGKAVLALPRSLDEDELEALWERYGAFVESLEGAFLTAADLGMSKHAMKVVARRTRRVLGHDYESDTPNDPGPYTAHGVHRGIQATLGQAFGSRDVAGRSILVEGLGGVGGPLCHSLAKEGAELLLADLDAAKAQALAQELGGRAVPLDQVPDTETDVYAPCAIGATVNPDTIPRLKCRIVAGSANNQLLTPEDANRLHQRGILYAPDYIINAGGAMAIVLLYEGMESEAIFRRVETIGSTVAEILAEAAEHDTSPLEAARRRVERRLAAARQG
jgi:leucine dehydrogenase